MKSAMADRRFTPDSRKASARTRRDGESGIQQRWRKPFAMFCLRRWKIARDGRCDAGHGWKRLFESCFQSSSEARAPERGAIVGLAALAGVTTDTNAPRRPAPRLQRCRSATSIAARLYRPAEIIGHGAVEVERHRDGAARSQTTTQACMTPHCEKGASSPRLLEGGSVTAVTHASGNACYRWGSRKAGRGADTD
jgi:hypothetical protein